MHYELHLQQQQQEASALAPLLVCQGLTFCSSGGQTRLRPVQCPLPDVENGLAFAVAAMNVSDSLVAIFLFDA